MFRTAAKKIAHNTMIPVLGANKDLRSLQDLITAEKAVLNSLERLSADLAKASEALKAWGLGEGDDLGDTLTMSCVLYQHFAEALKNYAGHEVSVREHMKAVRSREERLDELRRHRKSVVSEADSAERKLSKMNPDSKNLQAQTDHLNKLRDEIRIIDMDIMAEEASLSDFKRSTAKIWMGLKFGGLVECSQKGVIIGETGKMIIAEIPLETTDPGLPRATYHGYARTEALLDHARRTLNEVIFFPEPDQEALQQPIIARAFSSPELPAIPNRQSSISQFALAGPTSRRDSASMSSTYVMSQPDEHQLQSSPRNSQHVRSSQFDPSYSSFPMPPQAPFTQLGTQLEQTPSYEDLHLVGSPPPVNEAEFGILSAGMRSPRASSVPSPRFSTVPARAVGPRPLRGPSATGAARGSAYGTLPLRMDGRPPSLDVNPQDSFSSSIAEALGEDFEIGQERADPSSLDPPSKNGQEKKRPSMDSHKSYSPPPPQYSAAVAGTSYDPHRGSTEGRQPEAQSSYTSSPLEPPASAIGRENRRVTFESSPPAEIRPPAAQEPESAEQDRNSEGAHSVTTSNSMTTDEGSSQNPFENENNEVLPQEQIPETQESAAAAAVPPLPARSPTPPIDDRSLNAVAAREVSRELDSLMFNPAPAPAPTASPPATNRTPSPLVPPLAPFARPGPILRPTMNTAVSYPRPSSPHIAPQYVRERDKSLASPSVGSVSDEHTTAPSPAPSAPLSADDAASLVALPQAPALSVTQVTPSRATSASPFRTPSEHLAGSNASFYSLPPALTGSGTSFASQSGKISAAAFRRQQLRSPSMPPADIGGGATLADTSPLVVRKRPLPQSPTPPPSVRPGAMPRLPSVPLMGTMRSATLDSAGSQAQGRFRSASSAYPGQRDGADSFAGGERASRSPGGHEEAAESDDDYDYIEAYVGNGNGRGHGEDEHGRMGYERGRFATNLEGGGLR
ncbi:uncharacterized protein LAESUDRAFT_705438 [Laetiporus sulphureus 93-53]|uniref:Eisosome component PIL1-domain-containing protein n=1 Tax=Laetiporus sulphureus 93-53 TaxID=1314785 RepID=A0A165CH42_9APHY|nr:uncharacterized protein LAESUDRAFT_705438 [Laetiporus sulphureus 93-53]KZT02798.1 hypothetical protein LAESUDRAFT_705438 [Laetiporus sulphureus 93-53]